MKYIKTYENKADSKPKIDDYVLCDEKTKGNEILTNFVSSNIGRIADGPEPSQNGWYYTIQFSNYGRIKDLIESGGLRNMYSSEIVYSSPDKEDVEAYMKAKDFNI